jgi:hypothetical protein
MADLSKATRKKVQRHELMTDQVRLAVMEVGDGDTMEESYRNLFHEGSADRVQKWRSEGFVSDADYAVHGDDILSYLNSASHRGFASAAVYGHALLIPALFGECMLISQQAADELFEVASADIFKSYDFQNLPYPIFTLEFEKPLLMTLSGGEWGEYGSMAVFSVGASWTGVPGKRCAPDNKRLSAFSAMVQLTNIPDPDTNEPFRDTIGEVYLHESEEWTPLTNRGDIALPQGLKDKLKAVGHKPSKFVSDLFAGISYVVKKSLLFVTCRNIDYETVHRKNPRGKKWKHVPESTAQRELRIIAVNRTELRPDEVLKRNTDEESSLLYREYVPGTFHRWFYCRSCKRVHRHDLIGKECRRCKTVVGPVSNIIPKSYWHPPHWRGPDHAPEKDVVRKVVNRRSKVVSNRSDP